MKILHTADWHLGQTFYEYDRTFEHEQFLNWLVTTIKDSCIDVLLVCGDVFDVSNPSAASVKMFYTFLKDAVNANPNLQIIVVAGNHDSPSRLEAPKPLLEIFNITIIGNVQKTQTGDIDYEKLVIPIKNSQGEIAAWCMAVPFLKTGDYQVIADSEQPYTDGVSNFYKKIYDYTLTQLKEGDTIIALGHLHTTDAGKNDDRGERPIMGGSEWIPASAFDENIAYTALGHIHRAMKIGGRENVRYSGSPIPMSFSEENYKHQVVLIEIEKQNVVDIKTILVPVSVGLLRIPTEHKTLLNVLDELRLLPESETTDLTIVPYLQVKVLLDKPEPSLRHHIEQAISKKNVRLANIDTKYPDKEKEADKQTVLSVEQLNDLMPQDVFLKIYKSKYSSEPANELMQYLNEVIAEID